MNFYDLATRLTDKIRPAREATVLTDDPQQRMVDKYGRDMSPRKSAYEGEEYYKFWVLTDGTVIWVDRDHSRTAMNAGVSHEALLKSGAVRGHADQTSGDMAIAWRVMPNDDQIKQIQKIATRYGMKTLRSDDWNINGTGERHGLIKSPEHVEYIIKYGSVEEGKRVMEAVATLPELQQRMIDEHGTSEELVVSTWSSEEYLKFWILNDGTVIPVRHAHEQTCKEAGVGYTPLMESGALRGHIDEYGDADSGVSEPFMAVGGRKNPTNDQVQKLQKLFIKYGIQYVSFRSWSGHVPSVDHLAYLLEYGELDEKKVKEDGAGAGPSAGPVNGPAGGGATTENDIAALPVELGRKKKKKKTAVIRMGEATDEDLGHLRKELKQQMVKLMNREEFQVTADAVRAFQSAFGAGHPRTQRVAIKIERQQKDAQKLYGDILREHGDDRGSLEMVIAAMQEGRPLGQFAGLSKYDYLYGTRVEITFQGIDLVFEATVDFIYDPTQSMYVGDDELVDRIEEELGRSIKRKKNVIYPVGGKFQPDFFKQLKSMMSDSVQEPEHEDQEQSTETA